MAGIAAGVVTAGEVNGQPPAPSGGALSKPATWTYIWVGAATLYLVGIYVGMIRVGRER